MMVDGLSNHLFSVFISDLLTGPETPSGNRKSQTLPDAQTFSLGELYLALPYITFKLCSITRCLDAVLTVACLWVMESVLFAVGPDVISNLDPLTGLQTAMQQRVRDVWSLAGKPSHWLSNLSALQFTLHEWEADLGGHSILESSIW